MTTARFRRCAVAAGDAFVGAIASAGVLAIWSWWALWHWVTTLEAASLVGLLLPALLVTLTVAWLARRRVTWIAFGVASGGASALLVVGLMLLLSLQMSRFD